MNGLPLAVVTEAIGWTLFHFVWQGALIALALYCLLLTARGASAGKRYLAACTALFGAAVAFGLTLAWQIDIARGQLGHSEQGLAAVDTVPEAAGTKTASGPADPRLAVTDGDLGAGNSASGDLGGGELEGHPAGRDAAVADFAAWRDLLRRWLPTIVALWAAGVALLSLQLIAGWRTIRRLRAGAREIDDSVCAGRFADLRARLGVSPAVRLLASASATVPFVVGWLRPVVLVPAALLTALTTGELEAIFAHELAHIRRHDFLVNLLQNVVETLLFYHPAVWWMSAQIRTERENCCDDAAAALCGGALDYAKALVALERLRPATGLMVAASGGSLLARVRRLAGFEAPSRSGWPLAALLLVLASLLALLEIGRSSREPWQGEVDLPFSGSEAVDEVPPLRVRIERGPSGEVELYLNDSRTDEQTLRRLVADIVQGGKEPAVLLTGDKGDYHEVVRVLDWFTSLGVHKISLATRRVVGGAGSGKTPDEKPEPAPVTPDNATDGAAVAVDGGLAVAVADAALVEADKDAEEAGSPVNASGKAIDEHDNNPASEAAAAEAAAEKAPHTNAISVVDAETGEPIPRFRVLLGIKLGGGMFLEKFKPKHPGVVPMNWLPNNVWVGENGKLAWPFEWKGHKWYDFALRVEADGYVPQASAPFSMKVPLKQWTCRLKPDPGVEGRVLEPSGKPAVGATVAIALAQRTLWIDNGQLVLQGDRKSADESAGWRQPVFVKTDAEGRYRLPTETELSAVVVVVHDSGASEMDLADFLEQREITLVHWGRIEGQILWKDQPGADEPIELRTDRRYYANPPMVWQYRKIRSDQEGRFVVDKLLPGRVEVLRSFKEPEASADAPGLAPLIRQFVDVTGDGEPTPLVVGGKGRTVKFRLVGRDSWDGMTVRFFPDRSGFNSFERIPSPEDYVRWKQSVSGHLFFRDKLRPDANGSLEISDVLPGRYRMIVFAGSEKSPIGGKEAIYVPAEGLDEAPPINLGDVQVTRPDKPIGEPVGDAAQPAADGKIDQQDENAPPPGRFNGTEIIARVGPEVILASDVLPDANHHLQKVLNWAPQRPPANEIERARALYMSKFLEHRIETKLVVVEGRRSLPKEAWEKIEKQFNQQFEKEYLPKLIDSEGCDSKEELDAKLRKAGSSLDALRRQAMENSFAQHWLDEKFRDDREITDEEMRAYYEAHRDTYATPAEARWEHLMVRFDTFDSKDAARQAIAGWERELQARASFAEIARAHSQDASATDGGVHAWTDQGSLVSAVLDKALFSLPVGKLSEILEDKRGLHIIRVIQREDPKVTPFAEAQTKIENNIHQERIGDKRQQYKADLRKKIFPVWNMFDTVAGEVEGQPAEKPAAPAAPGVPKAAAPPATVEAKPAAASDTPPAVPQPEPSEPQATDGAKPADGPKRTVVGTCVTRGGSSNAYDATTLKGRLETVQVKITVVGGPDKVPINRFRVMTGVRPHRAASDATNQPPTNWRICPVRIGENGVCLWTPDQGAENDYQLLVEADGYRETFFSWIHGRLPSAVEFHLNPLSPVTIYVREPGKDVPAVRATVAVATPRRHAILENTHIRGDAFAAFQNESEHWGDPVFEQTRLDRPWIVKTDSDGTFQFDPDGWQETQLLIVHPSGAIEWEVGPNGRESVPQTITLDLWASIA
ncbi:MAG TPA: M56 family metallopeptidase, partial [Pirellulales bacterium]